MTPALVDRIEDELLRLLRTDLASVSVWREAAEHL